MIKITRVMALHPVMGLAVASMMAVAPARATVEPPGFGAVPAVRSFQLAPSEFESDILRGLEIDDPENSSALLFALLETGSKAMERSANVPSEVIFLIEGLVILALLSRGIRLPGTRMSSSAAAEAGGEA